jgi:hypothetical protein
MKKMFLALSLVALTLSATYVSAEQGLTATSAPVIMKAIIPEYIGLTAVNTSPVVFDFSIASKTTQQQLAAGWSNLMAIAPTAPSWNLVYNLRQRQVTVCAYASDLLGAEFHPLTLNKIPATFINGTSLQAQGNDASGHVWFGKTASCTTGFGDSVMLDQVKGATSTFNTGFKDGKPEGFSMLQINANPGNHLLGSTGAVPAPGVYLGVLYIVAQAI